MQPNNMLYSAKPHSARLGCPGSLNGRSAVNNTNVDEIVNKIEAYCKENNIVLTDGNYDETLKLAVSPEEYALMVIPDECHDKITKLCSRGDAAVNKDDYKSAIAAYKEAWDLIPEPKTNFEAATWVLTAIGDTYFLSGDFTAARDNLTNAMQCPDAVGNPFIHLRLGQCQFELDNEERAVEELTRALMIKGESIFRDENPKYFDFLKTKIDAPPGGWGQSGKRRQGRKKRKPWWKLW